METEVLPSTPARGLPAFRSPKTTTRSSANRPTPASADADRYTLCSTSADGSDRNAYRQSSAPVVNA
ncbi:hypothetical protein AB0I52_26080 [Streptomyces sp. NPDC050423]|uniref:hypothetical protein n=1 Tax=Streptomyces sp. NPDC050423 TaxID=3155402 RepID=UPI00341E7F4F